MAPQELLPIQEKRGISIMGVMKLLYFRNADLKRELRVTAKKDDVRRREEERSFAESVRVVLEGFVGGGVKKSGRERKVVKPNAAATSTTETIQNMDATPAVSSERELASPGDLQTIVPRARSVSFNEVVNEMLIETREQRYGDLAAKNEAFYSKTDFAIFKKAWIWHIQANDWPTDGLMRCSCPWCDKDGEGEPNTDMGPLQGGQEELCDEDLTTWTWGA